MACFFLPPFIRAVDFPERSQFCGHPIGSVRNKFNKSAG
jgi:hypothetical protein